MRLIQKNKLKIIALGILLAFTLSFSGLAIQTSSAVSLDNNVKLAANVDDGKTSGGSGNRDQRSTDPALNKKLCTDGSCPIVNKYINPFITMLAGLVGIVAVIAIIIGGIEFSSAGGDPQKAANGKRHIRNAIIGLVAFIFFWAFMQWVIPGGIGA